MKKIISSCIIFLLTISFGGCSSSSKDTQETESHLLRRLPITAVANEDIGFTTIRADQLGGYLEEDLVYLNLTDVNVEIGEVLYPLEEAIRDGLIYVEEIFAYARIDARNGICMEKYESKNGLTHFTYRYPEFDLRLTYDVYETPDGKTHLINDIGIYKSGSTVSTAYYDDETGERLDLEDWGLTFDVVATTPTTLTVDCTQSGGQYIGELTTFYYDVYNTAEDYKYLPRIDGIEYAKEINPPVTITPLTSTQFTIDWSKELGTLEPGSYSLALTICDNFDPAQVHPLMRNFHDQQRYWIPFTIE